MEPHPSVSAFSQSRRKRIRALAGGADYSDQKPPMKDLMRAAILQVRSMRIRPMFLRMSCFRTRLPPLSEMLQQPGELTVGQEP